MGQMHKIRLLMILRVLNKYKSCINKHNYQTLEEDSISVLVAEGVRYFCVVDVCLDIEG